MSIWFDRDEAIKQIHSIRDGKSLFWKYVRVNGKYLFANAMDIQSPPHKSALKEGETAESAAFVNIFFSNGIEVHVEGWSMTLGIGPTSDDEQNLKENILKQEGKK